MAVAVAGLGLAAIAVAASLLSASGDRAGQREPAKIAGVLVLAPGEFLPVGMTLEVQLVAQLALTAEGGPLATGRSMPA
jgi:hypothetical protein